MECKLKNNINQEWIAKLFATVFVALIFLLAFTWIIFDFQKSSNSLKDSWAIVGSLFGGFATLTAAYMAYSLYVDWRTPHDLNIETQYKKEILNVIRKLSPLEFTYDRLVSNHFLYKSDPQFTIPIEINNEELNNLSGHINELLGLLDELYIITRDNNIELLKKQYFNYAQLYSFVLVRANYLYKNEEKTELIEFLGTELKFDYINTEGQNCRSHTFYAHVFTGLRHTKLRNYISERLKATHPPSKEPSHT